MNDEGWDEESNRNFIEYMEKQYNDDVIRESKQKVYEMVKNFPDTLEPPVQDSVASFNRDKKLDGEISYDANAFVHFKAFGKEFDLF